MAELLHIDGIGSVDYQYFKVAQSFTPDGNWLVDSIWFGGLWYFMGDAPASSIIQIFTDVAGEPGVQVGSNSGAETINDEFSPGGAYTFTFAVSISLDVGVTYWVVMETSGAGGVGTGVQRTAASVYSGGSIARNSGSWTVDSDYDVEQMKVNGSSISVDTINIRGLTAKEVIIGG